MTGRWRFQRADLALVSLAAGGGALMLWFAPAADPGRRPHPFEPAFILDVALGLLVCLTLCFGRRWPVAVGLATLVPELFAQSASIGALLSVLVVAMCRRPLVAVAVAAAHQVLIFAYYPRWVSEYPFWAVFLWSLTEVAGLVAFGMWLRTRAQLVASLREQVASAHAEQHLLTERARQAERSRIAWEMHDVVAHRVSLMALHAGALEVRPDQPPAAISESAALIRATARQALEELRGVLGVLRAGQDAAGRVDGPELAPQPTLRDLPRLVEESRQAGIKVELAMRVECAEQAPGVLGRDTYRIVREALTNVGKHAEGAATMVTVNGRPGDGLRVSVRNRLPVHRRDAALPGAGAGLVGLTERVALTGGKLRHGPSPDGDFVVEAELRWAAS